MPSPVWLEGTTLEGGGQLLRIAIGVSSLTSIPIRLTNIRGKRSGGGGLKAQHLTSVQWLGRASGAALHGADLKSRDLTFKPTSNESRDIAWLGTGRSNSAIEISISQNTPGSINLVLQAVLPYCVFSGSATSPAAKPIRLTITGGTNVSNSPSYDYVCHVLLPMLEKIGLPPMEAELHSRSWSQGSSRIGSASYTLTPFAPGTTLPSFNLMDRGGIQSIKAIVLAPKDYEQDLRDELGVMFTKQQKALFGDDEPDIDIAFEDSRHEKRFYLLLIATTSNGCKLGRDWLYDQGVRAGKLDRVISNLVKKVTDDLIFEIKHGGCVDEYLRDQLVVFQALAKGKSSVHGGRGKDNRLLQPSLHTKTAQWVVSELLGVTFDEQGSCEGTGFAFGKTLLHVDEIGEKEVNKDLEGLKI